MSLAYAARMSRAQGWGLPSREMSQIRLLDWIYEQTAGDYPSGIPDVRSFADEKDLSPDSVDGEVRALERQGLLRLGPARASGVGTVYLTDAGRRAVEERGQRREDPALRRRACRDAFLAWLDAQPGSPTNTVAIDGFLRDHRSIYEGDQFRPTDVEAATAYLRDRGLISGVDVAEFGGPVEASITAAGLDCIDRGGSVVEYLNREHSSTTFQTHFSAPITGQVGVAPTSV